LESITRYCGGNNEISYSYYDSFGLIKIPNQDAKLNKIPLPKISFLTKCYFLELIKKGNKNEYI